MGSFASTQQGLAALTCLGWAARGLACSRYLCGRIRAARLCRTLQRTNVFGKQGQGGIVKLRRKRWHAADENLAVDLNPARQTVE